MIGNNRDLVVSIPVGTFSNNDTNKGFDNRNLALLFAFPAR